MRTTITSYQIQIPSSVTHGMVAQILLGNDTSLFVGRIDFYQGVEVPTSYFWHPSMPIKEENTYIVLSMSFSAFDSIQELLRNESPWAMELWPIRPMNGRSTDGYGGRLFLSINEPIKEMEFNYSTIR